MPGSKGSLPALKRILTFFVKVLSPTGEMSAFTNTWTSGWTNMRYQNNKRRILKSWGLTANESILRNEMDKQTCLSHECALPTIIIPAGAGGVNWRSIGTDRRKCSGPHKDQYFACPGESVTEVGDKTLPDCGQEEYRAKERTAQWEQLNCVQLRTSNSAKERQTACSKERQTACSQTACS